MNQDFDRRSLDHRINDIEKIKFSNNTFPSIDFDAYEDNSILRTKDGVVFKCFYDLPSFQLNICGICSTRYGIISGQNLAMARLVVKNASNPYKEGYVIPIRRYGDLGEDCSTYALLNDPNVGLDLAFNVGLNFFSVVVALPHTTSSSRTVMTHIIGDGYGASLYIDKVGTGSGMGQGVYFSRGIGCNLIGTQRQNVPMYLFSSELAFVRYNTVSDLPNKYKPLFPASWSV